MNRMNVHNTINIYNTGDYDSSNNNPINNSVPARDSIIVFRPPSPSLTQALMAYIPNTNSNTVDQQRHQNDRENVNPLDISSRVTIAVGKYPSDATLRNYDDLQMWMYIHTIKWAPADVCQSLTQHILLHSDRYDSHTRFNVRLICAEAYQVIGNLDQAYCEYDATRAIKAKLDNTTRVLSLYEVGERDRKRKKLKEIAMKLNFQSKFKCNVIEDQTRQSSNLSSNDFLNQLNMDNISPEQCYLIWRRVVHETALHPNIAIRAAEWLFRYASGFQPNTIGRANILLVALNLFLFDYGPQIFQKRLDIDVFTMLDNISLHFDQYGNQSKQFSPVQKMARVWGTAALVFLLRSDEQKYFVCASMFRVSFESLGICFLSSGMESLYIAAKKYAPDFFTMMAYDPSIKLAYPPCINYFRRKLQHSMSSIPYSNAIVDQFVSEVFNIDASDHQV